MIGAFALVHVAAIQNAQHRAQHAAPLRRKSWEPRRTASLRRKSLNG
jgi:hypothetical protein